MTEGVVPTSFSFSCVKPARFPHLVNLARELIFRPCFLQLREPLRLALVITPMQYLDRVGSRFLILSHIHFSSWVRHRGFSQIFAFSRLPSNFFGGHFGFFQETVRKHGSHSSMKEIQHSIIHMLQPYSKLAVNSVLQEVGFWPGEVRPISVNFDFHRAFVQRLGGTTCHS